MNKPIEAAWPEIKKLLVASFEIAEMAHAFEVTGNITLSDRLNTLSLTIAHAQQEIKARALLARVKGEG